MIGTTVSHYKITDKLGEGGMGVVYKAQDTRLNRAVALKFLPGHIQEAEKDKERFLQEAQAAASLSHSNICTIHGIEEHDGKQFIVMEFVDGRMLQEKKDGLPLKQALEIGIQIADGLAAAHDKGIVHRDIKPENIMIKNDGTVQIMDFGLAKLRGATRLTKEGSTVGTVGYMSPEQVQGMDVDHRTDIFSLGVLLYEMFAGQSPFKGVHETAIIYEIVNVDPPPMGTIRQEIDTELDAIVLDCLAKEPADRYQSAAELARNLRRFKRESSRSRVSRVTGVRSAVSRPNVAASHPGNQGSSHFRRHLPWALGILALVSTSVAVYVAMRLQSDRIPWVHAAILPPAGMTFHPYGWAAGPATVSPDGSTIVYSAITSEGTSLLYFRRLEASVAIIVPGSDGAYYPFWSPNSRWIGFFTGPTGKLKKADIFGNPSTTICDAVNARGGSWNANDMIVFSPGATENLLAVPASGGEPYPVTRIDTTKNESSHRWPYFLPDGEHFLYLSRKISYGEEAEGDAIVVGSMDGSPPVFVVQSAANAIFVSGHLLYVRGPSLVAQPFDPDEFTLFGQSRKIADNVTTDPGFSLSTFSASRNGVLAYHTGEGIAGARMIIVDLAGRPISYVGDVIEHFAPAISPSQDRVMVSIFDPKSRTQNLWLYDLRRGIRTRFTTGLFTDNSPVWSPDGQRVAFIRKKLSTFELRIHPAYGAGTEEVVFESQNALSLNDWSSDGKTFIIAERDRSSLSPDLYVLSLDGDRTPAVLVKTPYAEVDGKFSPDNRWVAYTSSQTGEPEVYVRSYPRSGREIKVSHDGGILVDWRGDGKELFYINPENKIIAVTIVRNGTNLDVGRVRTLFERSPIMTTTAAFRDGKRFLITRVIELTDKDPITLVLNWTSLLGAQR